MGNCILNDAAHIPQPSTCILCPFPTINFSYIYWQVNHRFACYLVAAVGVFCGSALSSDFNSLNKPAASRIRLNSIQKACTSMKISLTSIILFLIRDCRKTHTKRTRRFCKYLSRMVSQVEIQFEMYRWMNSEGSSTAVVSLLTTSIE